MAVLVLGQEHNPSADRLVQTLGVRGVPVLRADLAAAPHALTVDARYGPAGWDGVLATAHRELRLRDIRSVWHRCPSNTVPLDGRSANARQPATATAARSVGDVLSGLDLLWVNHPARESLARTPHQLDMARRCGLRVPGSLVTSRSAAVPDADAEPETEPETRPYCFRPIEPKAFAVRTTVVGDEVFAVAMRTMSDAARVDWSSDHDTLDYVVVKPPQRVAAGMLAFLRTFGLSFAAFDFAVTPDGEWIMFECDPAGQYGWLEDALGLPITDTLADLLAAGR